MLDATYAILSRTLRRVAPVVRYTACSYSAAGAARRAFTEAVHAQLINRFLFSNLIEVIINIQLDTQTIMESDALWRRRYYSKSINDAMKGRDGVFIDDCQIYPLSTGFELTWNIS